MSFRVPPELKETMDRAATDSGRSVAQEIEIRLNQSFSFGGPAEFSAMVRMMGAYLGAGQRMARADNHPEWGTKEWEMDPHCYEQAILAVVVALWEAHPNPAAGTPPDLWWEGVKSRLATRAIMRGGR
jgi:hypothetical protein